MASSVWAPILAEANGLGGSLVPGVGGFAGVQSGLHGAKKLCQSWGAVTIVLLIFYFSLAANLAFAAISLDIWCIPAIFVGWFVADLLSGLVHMTMDYWPCRSGVGFDQIYFYPGDRSSEEYEVLRRKIMNRVGPFQRLIYDFKNHHPRPDALGRRSLRVQIGSTVVVVALPISLLLNFWCWFGAPPGWMVAGSVALLLGGSFAQYFHGTLHRKDNPAIILIMRNLRLLMTPEDHQKHHDSLKCDFATNNGWSNRIINPAFRFLYRHGWLNDRGLEPRS